jgi:hypothetical protein
MGISKYFYSIEYYPAMKRQELSNHKKHWREIKSTLFSERYQSKKLALL